MLAKCARISHICVFFSLGKHTETRYAARETQDTPIASSKSRLRTCAEFRVIREFDCISPSARARPTYVKRTTAAIENY